MAAGIPPPPLNSPAGSYYWLEWYTSLTNFLDGTNIPWSNINFSGSNITDIITRNHNDLQNLQGGTQTNRYHLHGCGQVDSTGTIFQLPSGWSVSRTGTGVYQIIHNLNISVADMIIAANLSGTGVNGWCVPAPLTVNTFEIICYNPSGVGQNSAFTFVCTSI